MKRLLFILVIFSFVSTGLRSQTYYFKHYQVENGLSNNTVFSSVQDQDGFMWFGTKDGLNRFDGTTFKVFRNDPEDSLSLGDNFIRSLYLDKKEALYIGTRSGLYKYNFATEKFSLIFKTDSEIKDVKKDAEDNVWFISGQTLIKFNEVTKAEYIYHNSTYFSATSICINEGNDVWVSTSDGRLLKMSGVNHSFVAFDLFKNSPQVNNKWIEKIYATDAGFILIGTSNHGVKIFEINKSMYEDLLTYNEDKTAIFARDFIQSSPGEYWIATESGIFILSTTTKKITNLKKSYTNPYSLSDNAVYTLLKDKEGGIWAGTYFGGANYFPVQYSPFKKYFPDYKATSLSGNAVREICADNFGNLWIGTEDAGLNKFDTATGYFTQFKPTGTREGISYSNIHGLLVKNNELWIGTFEHGLNIMDIKTGKVVKLYPQGKTSGKLKSNFIVTLINTRRGNIYIGTRNGLYRFDFAGNTFLNIPEIPADCFVHSILEDKNGILWIGTMGKGLYYYDPIRKIARNILHDPKNKISLSSNSVTTVFEDSSGQMWVGTEGGGLCRYIPETNSFTSYQVKDGLPGNTIYKILEDSKANLWISTSQGLVCLTPRTNKIKIFTVSNGLLSDQFNYNSGYKDPNGTMYFGSVKGLISFNPDKFFENNYQAPLFITNITVNNQDLVVNSKESPLKKSILYTRAITLKHNQSSFAIDFAALGFTAPEVVQYKYTMAGLEKNWTVLKNKRRIYFTNLLPGKYIFKIKAASLNGEWQSNETALTINILPPFWASPRAFLVYIFLAIVGAYYLFKLYHRNIADKNRRKIEILEHSKEKEIYQAKINFFTNVAHEIKTPLTLIKAPLEKVLKNIDEDSKNGFNLRIMEKNTEKLIYLTNQLLDFRQVEMNGIHLSFTRINLTALLEETSNNFKPLLEEKKISIQLFFPDDPVFADLDPDAFQKIVNNLFLNAINYCEQTVIIKLNEDRLRNVFNLKFKNDGLLIERSLSDKIFDPFYRIKNNKHSGNGLGLALSRSIAILHNGTLELSTTENGLNIFTLVIPLHQNK